MATLNPHARVSRYTLGAIILHWAIALLIIVQIPLGWWMVELAPRGSGLQFDAFQIHKSLGVLVLILSVARVMWRLFNPPPAMPYELGRFEQVGARISHILFYVLIFAIPFSGWVMVSVAPIEIDTVLFFIPALGWPHLPLGVEGATREAVYEGSKVAHEWLAYGAGVLVLIHVAAALKHQFAGENVIGRMLPGAMGRIETAGRSYGFIATVVVTLAVVGGGIWWGDAQRVAEARALAAASSTPDTTAPSADGTTTPATGTTTTAANDGSQPAQGTATPSDGTAATSDGTATTGVGSGTGETPSGQAGSGAPAASSGGGTGAANQEPVGSAAFGGRDTSPPADTETGDAATPANPPIVARPESAGPASPEQATPLPDALPAVDTPSLPVTEPWTVDYANSSLSFSFPMGGETITGGVEKWSADIVFDPEHLVVSSISVIMQMSTVSVASTDISESQLKGGDGFDTADFGVAEFSASTITEAGEGSYVADGTLTIRGVRQDVSLPFDLTISDDVGRAEGTASVDRLAFGIGRSNDGDAEFVPQSIDVRVEVTATPPAAITTR